MSLATAIFTKIKSARISPDVAQRLTFRQYEMTAKQPQLRIALASSWDTSVGEFLNVQLVMHKAMQTHRSVGPPIFLG